jgi:hypothetical protein
MTRRALVPAVALGGLGLILALTLAGCDPLGRQQLRQQDSEATRALDEVRKIDPEAADSLFRPTRRRGALSSEAAEIESHFNIGR